MFHRVSFSRAGMPFTRRPPKSSVSCRLRVTVNRPVSIFLRVLTGIFFFSIHFIQKIERRLTSALIYWGQVVLCVS